jgi:hypothetical protein
MSKPNRSMDSKGLNLLRANEYRLLQAAAAIDPNESHSSGPDRSGEAAPPILIGGTPEQNIGKMDIGDRKAALGIDWIQGTIPFDRMDLAFDYLYRICGTKPEIYNHGFLGFQAAAEWHPFNIKIMWDLDHANRRRHKNRIVIQFGGTALACISATGLKQLCSDLCHILAFKCSRCDFCFDDFERIIEVQEVAEHANRGSYAGFRVHDPRLPRDVHGKLRSASCNFGGRGKNGGGKYLRCYDKFLESKGAINSIRWEVEFSKARANQIFFKLAMTYSMVEFVSLIAQFIGGSIDFIERHGKRLNPMDRLAFWEQILDTLGAATIRNPQPEKSIEKAENWISKTCSSTMQMIIQAKGETAFYEWLNTQIDQARLKPPHQEAINVYHRTHGTTDPAAPF